MPHDTNEALFWIEPAEHAPHALGAHDASEAAVQQNHKRDENEGADNHGCEAPHHFAVNVERVLRQAIAFVGEYHLLRALTRANGAEAAALVHNRRAATATHRNAGIINTKTVWFKNESK